MKNIDIKWIKKVSTILLFAFLFGNTYGGNTTIVKLVDVLDSVIYSAPEIYWESSQNQGLEDERRRIISSVLVEL